MPHNKPPQSSVTHGNKHLFLAPKSGEALLISVGLAPGCELCSGLFHVFHSLGSNILPAACSPDEGRSARGKVLSARVSHFGHVTFANIPLASHTAKPNARGVGKYTLPLWGGW